MSQRYVTQRDPDGTWSVREAGTNCPAIDMGKVMAGLDESAAVLTARRFNNWGLVRISDTSPQPLTSKIQTIIHTPPLRS